jgi:hypothetical protein
MHETSTRAHLHEANANLETRARELAQAETLVSKADKQKSVATAAVQNSLVVKNQVVQWRLDAMKRNSSEAMPSDLIESRREAASAEEELEHATVLSHLELERDAAKQNLASAEKAKTDAVNALMMEEVEHIVDEIKELGRRRQYLRDILRGVFFVNASRDQHQKLSLLVEPSMHDHSIAQLAYPPSSPGSKKYWKDFGGALSSDPDAELGQPPAAEDLWS